MTNMKSLLDAPANKEVKVISIVGGKNSRQILAQLGVGIGSLIIIKRNAPFSGPLLIQNHGTSIAIGRGIAAKIMIEEV
ncbi:MAG: FeoA domain-containing protein [Calditrichia bacterium]